MAKTLNSRLNLKGFISKEVEVQGANGKVKGLFIPYEANNLFVGKKGVYADAISHIKDESDDYGSIGFTKLVLPWDKVKDLTDNDARKEANNARDEFLKANGGNPYVGNFEEFGARKTQDQQQSNDEKSDLPF